MNRWQWLLLSFLAAAAPFASAQDAPVEDPADTTDIIEDDVAVVAADSGRLVCRVFLTDLHSPVTMDTSDGTTEVGQWVQEQSESGLVLYSVDFEVGQKATGYPQGYVYVCVYPAP